jgi:hypothetical protein
VLDIVHVLCVLANRRLGIFAGGIIGAIRPYQPRKPQSSVLSDNASTLMKAVGLRVGNPTAQKTDAVSKIAVITPYYKEPESELRRCLGSVKSQTYPCDHILVSDGFPAKMAEESAAIHIALGTSHQDNGNTPRYVGAMIALALGYDGIAFLDADNWFEPNHIATLVKTQAKTGASVVCSYRNIYLPDGHLLPDFDFEEWVRTHVDTSCYFFTRDCEYAMHIFGQMPREWGPICDRVVFSVLSGMHVVWTEQRTLNFQSNYAAHFLRAGKPVPKKVNEIPPQLRRKLQQVSDTEIAVSRIGRKIS